MNRCAALLHSDSRLQDSISAKGQTAKGQTAKGQTLLGCGLSRRYQT